MRPGHAPLIFQKVGKGKEKLGGIWQSGASSSFFPPPPPTNADIPGRKKTKVEKKNLFFSFPFPQLAPPPPPDAESHEGTFLALNGKEEPGREVNKKQSSRMCSPSPKWGGGKSRER